MHRDGSFVITTRALRHHQFETAPYPYKTIDFITPLALRHHQFETAPYPYKTIDFIRVLLCANQMVHYSFKTCLIIQLAGLVDTHGMVILYDCNVPFLLVAV